jgi:hypothetical protein
MPKKAIHGVIPVVLFFINIGFINPENKIEKEPEIVTQQLIARLQQLLAVPKVQTNKMLDNLLTGPYQVDLSPTKQYGFLTTRRDGKIINGLPVCLIITTFPDGFREGSLSLGPAHFLIISDFEGMAIRVRLSFLKNEKPINRRLYFDEMIAKKAKDAWSGYCERISLSEPSLPALKLNEQYRNDFISLYERTAGGVFGTFCDYAGTPPDDRLAQVRMLHAGQKTAFRYILRSKSTVSKLYAAEALLLLKKQNQRLDSGDIALLNKLQNDEQLIETCEGCEYSYISAGKVFNLFKTESIEKVLGEFKKLGYIG